MFFSIATCGLIRPKGWNLKGKIFGTFLTHLLVKCFLSDLHQSLFSLVSFTLLRLAPQGSSPATSRWFFATVGLRSWRSLLKKSQQFSSTEQLASHLGGRELWWNVMSFLWCTLCVLKRKKKRRSDEEDRHGLLAKMVKMVSFKDKGCGRGKIQAVITGVYPSYLSGVKRY